MLYPFSLTLDLYIQAESFEEAKKLAEAYVQDASLDTTDYPEIVQDVLGGTNCNEGSMDWLFGSLGNENFYVCQPASFYKSQQEIEKVNPLYAFKVATAYFRGQGLVPVFEDCHCRLIILRYGVG